MIERYTCQLSDFSEIHYKSEEEKIVLKAALEKIQKEIDTGRVSVGRTKKLQNAESLKIVDYFNEHLYTQGIVGALKTKVEVTLNNKLQDIFVEIVIKSRFDDDTSKPYFLAKMLENSDLSIGSELTTCSYDDIFEFLLVALFKSKFLTAYQVGYYKEYQTYNKKTFKPKGKIDFINYIKNIGYKDGTIPFTYAERTLDNPLNHIILTAYNLLKKRFPKHVEILIDSTDIKNILEVLRSESNFVEKDFRSLINLNSKNITHPLFNNYEELRVLCLKILMQDGISPFEFENGETEAVLYYIPDLWEEYIESQIFSEEFKEEYIIRSQEKLKVVKSANIRPDFVIYNRKNKTPYCILDAKFKDKWSKGEFDLDDYTKCIRDMNAFNCNIVGIVFPTKEACSVHVDKISEYNTKDNFLKVAISVPSSINFDYFLYSKILNENALKASKELFKTIELFKT